MILEKRKFVTRFLPGLFTGLLLLSGCSQDDVSDIPAGSRAIGFRAQGGMPTLKATTANSNSIQSFIVNAHYDDGNGTPEWDAANDYLLYGTTVYRGEGGTGWYYSPQAYFPTASGTVEFFAYSPSGSKYASGLGTASDENQTIAYTVPKPNGSITTQEDLLVAYESVGSDVYAIGSPTVTLMFRHALSRISVSAYSSHTEPVTITRLELKNLKNSGKLKLKGNISTGANKSDGIPVSTSSTAQTDWFYTAPSAVGDTDDYVVLWEPLPSSDAPSLTDYTYALPDAGVKVSKDDFKPVIGSDQGMFVMPQTTVGNPDGDAEKGVTEDHEFGLYVEYVIGDALTPIKYYIQFGDLADPAPIADTGVTFEIGRQYAMKLSFGAGSGNVPTGHVMAFITGGEGIGTDDSYEEDPIDVRSSGKDPDHRVSRAASNIYFEPDDGNGGASSTGILTFSPEDQSKSGDQGVFFKRGSLTGVSSMDVPINESYLFIPKLHSRQVKAIPNGEATFGHEK
ncbi:MAG: fimbrillin family protein [Prevotella sp.]|jgi:hypothetical protein|nr:fimbrillin family protein [Prevotella sp.]